MTGAPLSCAVCGEAAAFDGSLGRIATPRCAQCAEFEAAAAQVDRDTEALVKIGAAAGVLVRAMAETALDVGIVMPRDELDSWMRAALRHLRERMTEQARSIEQGTDTDEDGDE